jgi:protein-S-isoprenylcysteine O-methyltransferase Ste14
MACDQIFLGTLIFVYLSTFVASLVIVRRRGYDPKGVIGEHVGGAIVTSGASLLWLVVALLYTFKVQSVVWFRRIDCLDHSVVKGMGIALSAIGLVVGIAGEAALGESFCLAFPRSKIGLVTRGIYRYIRNPCVLGTFLLVLGTLFIAPSLVALLALVANFVGYELKVRAEEKYLRQMYPDEYEAYCARTGRYLPSIRR